MVEARRIIVDCKTGKQKIEFFDFETIPTEPPYSKGIDTEKLKQILLRSGLIKDLSEIEPDELMGQ